MAYVATIDGDIHINGKLTCNSIKLPVDTIADENVPGAANIAATKLEQRHRITYSQESATTVVTETRTVHVVHGATGTLRAFRAGSITANVGAATITADIKKNGVSVLTAVITLNNGHVARQVVAGAFSSTALVAGDVLEVTIVATAGGGTLGKGVFAEVVLDEKAV